MISKNSNVSRDLKKLREQINDLRQKPRLSNRFRLWRDRLISTATEAFGVDSLELHEVLAIKFELEPEVLDHLVDTLQNTNLIAEALKTEEKTRGSRGEYDPTLFSDQAENLARNLRDEHFKKNLDKAYEIISSFLWQLEKS